MRSTLWLGFGTAIILLSLALMGMAQVTQGETDDSRQISQEVLASLTSCGPPAPERPIPDNGRWLQVCLLDPMAPEGTRVSAVHVKFLIEHPDPDQLEIRLSQEDIGVEEILWDRGKTTRAEFEKASDSEAFLELQPQSARPLWIGKSVDLEAFRGAPSQGKWYLWIRDVVPGQSGRLKSASLVVEYVPTGPLPTVLSGDPGRLTSRRLPDGVLPSQTPDRDKEKTGGDTNCVCLRHYV